MNKDKKVSFRATIAKCICDYPSFKIYAADIDKGKYPAIRCNKYGNVSLIGDLQGLSTGVEYEIVATEQHSKYGIGYNVLSIRRDVPITLDSTRAFLREVLTLNQADELLKHYPDIIQRVRENRLDDIDLNKLYGIKEKTFEKIKEKIIENFCLFDLIALFDGAISTTIMRKLYEKYPSIETIKHHLRIEPYKCLCDLARVGFKTADSILLSMEAAGREAVKNGKEPSIQFNSDLKTSIERCQACIYYLLSQNEGEGHTKMSVADLKAACQNLTPACAKHFFDALNDPEFYFCPDANEASLKNTFNTEQYIAQTIISGLAAQNTVWDYDVEAYRMVDGIALSDEQLSCAKNVCKYTVSILNGAAGTGKSFSTQAIINLLEANQKTYRLFSPTGKAAKVLTNYTKRHASTIHRGLGWNPGDGEWTFCESNKLDADIVIVDEFSMVDIWLFQRLLKAIDFNRTKLLLIGDNAQLPSVSCGNLLHDFMETRLIPSVTLKTVFRYSEGGLMKVATDVRFRKPYLNSGMRSKATVFGNNKDYTFVDVPAQSMQQTIVQLYRKLLSLGNSMENIQVLTAKNGGECGTIDLNNEIQRIANPNYSKTACFSHGESVFFEGDLVIQKANNYKAMVDPDHYSPAERLLADEYPNKEITAFIANGETGIIRSICASYAIIEFDNVFVRYSQSDFDNLSLGYAITLHKSQGSSIDNVILCTPKSHFFMLNSNLIYVGLTRMRKTCFHLGELDTINKAVLKKENLTRHTFMQRLLKSEVEKKRMQ